MKVYVDDMLVKSRLSMNHVDDLSKMFNVPRKYEMKCSFGVA